MTMEDTAVIATAAGWAGHSVGMTMLLKVVTGRLFIADHCESFNPHSVGHGPSWGPSISLSMTGGDVSPSLHRE